MKEKEGEQHHTIAAVPQEEDSIEYLVITDRVISFRDSRTRTVPGPILVIPERNGSRTSCQRDDSGQWKLFTQEMLSGNRPDAAADE